MYSMENIVKEEKNWYPRSTLFDPTKYLCMDITVASLGQTGVRMPLPVNTSAEMFVDLGDAREKYQCELHHAI